MKLVDFAHYAPSLGEPASFVAAPIVDGAWLLGVLVLQMPVGEIDGVMTSNRNWRDRGSRGNRGDLSGGGGLSDAVELALFLEDPEGFIAAERGGGCSDRGPDS